MMVLGFTGFSVGFIIIVLRSVTIVREDKFDIDYCPVRNYTLLPPS